MGKGTGRGESIQWRPQPSELTLVAYLRIESALTIHTRGISERSSWSCRRSRSRRFLFLSRENLTVEPVLAAIPFMAGYGPGGCDLYAFRRRHESF